MEVIISESKKFICITLKPDNNKAISWEKLQETKDMFYPDLDFIEVYPKKDEIINKANERHLIHKKGLEIPKLWDLEEESKIEIKNV